MSNKDDVVTASPALAPTVTSAELGAFLDLVASAPVALRDVPRMNHLLARLVGLANAKHPVGEIVPPPVRPPRKPKAPAVPAAGG